MRILCLDIGEKRIGVAISDPLGITAQGVTTIQHKTDQQSLAEIDKLQNQYQATRLVVGLPLNMDGSESQQTKSVRHFGDKLKKRFRQRADIIYWDERLSTVAAERGLLEADLSRNKRRQVIDKMAAVFILQGYLDSQKHQTL